MLMCRDTRKCQPGDGTKKAKEYLDDGGPFRLYPPKLTPKALKPRWNVLVIRELWLEN